MIRYRVSAEYWSPLFHFTETASVFYSRLVAFAAALTIRQVLSLSATIVPKGQLLRDIKRKHTRIKRPAQAQSVQSTAKIMACFVPALRVALQGQFHRLSVAGQFGREFLRACESFCGPVTGVGSEVEIESPPILTLLGANGNKSIRLGSFGAT